MPSTHHQPFVFYSPGLTPCLADAGPQEIEPVPKQETPADVGDQLKKAGFPEVEGDLSPAALVPKTSVCVEKHMSKLEALKADFAKVAEPTPLQRRSGLWGRRG